MNLMNRFGKENVTSNIKGNIDPTSIASSSSCQPQNHQANHSRPLSIGRCTLHNEFMISHEDFYDQTTNLSHEDAGKLVGLCTHHSNVATLS